MNSKIPIIVGVYNTNPVHLEECINSCLNQTYKNIEIVIANNGSDNLQTLEILNSYSILENITILDCPRKENVRNHSVSRNCLLNYVINKNYKYAIHIDSDDIMDINRTEIQINFLEENEDIDILGCQMSQINSNGLVVGNMPQMISTPTKQNINLGLLYFLYHPTVAFRLQSLKNKTLYSELMNDQISFPEDLEFWLRCLYEYELKIYNLQDQLVKYRIHDKSTCGIEGKTSLWDINEKIIRDKYRNR